MIHSHEDYVPVFLATVDLASPLLQVIDLDYSFAIGLYFLSHLSAIIGRRLSIFSPLFAHYATQTDCGKHTLPSLSDAGTVVCRDIQC